MSFAALKTLFSSKPAKLPKIKIVTFNENGEHASEKLYELNALLS